MAATAPFKLTFINYVLMLLIAIFLKDGGRVIKMKLPPCWSGMLKGDSTWPSALCVCKIHQIQDLHSALPPEVL